MPAIGRFVCFFLFNFIYLFIYLIIDYFPFWPILSVTSVLRWSNETTTYKICPNRAVLKNIYKTVKLDILMVHIGSL